MLTTAENKTLTETGAETPMGAVFRRYWTPALLSRELPVPNSGPLRLTLLGEDFIAFRASDGEVGAMSSKARAESSTLAVHIEALSSFSVETKIADYAAFTTAGNLTFTVNASTFQMPVTR